VKLKQVSFRVLQFAPPITIPLWLDTPLSPPHRVYDGPDQAAHYHILGSKLWASSLAGNLAGLLGDGTLML
jgi:hypothetical protein